MSNVPDRKVLLARFWKNTDYLTRSKSLDKHIELERRVIEGRKHRRVILLQDMKGNR